MQSYNFYQVLSLWLSVGLYLDLYVALRNHKDLRDYDHLFDTLKSNTNVQLSESDVTDLKNWCRRFCYRVYTKWVQSRRTVDKFINKNEEWLNSDIVWPDCFKENVVDTEEANENEAEEVVSPSKSDASTSTYTSPRKRFEDLSTRHKRRRFYTAWKLSRILRFLKFLLTKRLLYTFTSKWRYVTLRDFSLKEGHAKYPSYYLLVKEKLKCYPAKEDITVTETSAKIRIQALLDLTVRRLIDSLESNFDAGEQLVLHSYFKETEANVKAEMEIFETEIRERNPTDCGKATVTHNLWLTMIDGKHRVMQKINKENLNLAPALKLCLNVRAGGADDIIMPKHKKQKVWRHYHSLPDKSVKCTFCSKMYRVPNVTKMGTHLLKCPKCPLVIRNELTESCEETSLIASNTTNSAITEGGYVTSTPSDATPLLEFTEEKKRRLTKLLSKAIYVTGSPLSMVEHPLWREFFKELQPLFELPTRKVVNLQKAFDLVKLEHPNVITLNCVAHTLNLLCHDIMKEDAIEAFISVAIDVIKSVKKSQILCALFKQIIAEKGSGEQLKLPSKTRWGSYFHAVRSLQNSKAALQCLAVHEDAKMIPADIKAHLLDEEFWKMIDESTAILEPITDYIFKLEGNESYINDVYMAFKDIKSRLVFLLPGFSSLFDDNIRDRILNAVDKRRENCIKPIHLAAYMLDPKCQGIEMNEDEEIIAMDFIHEKGRQLNLEVITDLANYRAREGFWAKSFVWASLQNMKPLTWWKGICKNKALSKVAACLLTAPCTSAATERTFSIHGNIHSLKRNSPSTIKNIEPQPSTSGRNTRQIEFCDEYSGWNDRNFPSRTSLAPNINNIRLWEKTIKLPNNPITSYTYIYSIPNNNDTILIPKNPYLILGNNEFAYPHEPCDTITDNEVICKHLEWKTLLHSNDCIAQIIQHQEPHNCTYAKAKYDNNIIQQIKDNSWIDVQYQRSKGVFLITTDSKCKIQIRDRTLSTHQKYINIRETIPLPRAYQTPNVTPIKLKLDSINLDNLKDALRHSEDISDPEEDAITIPATPSWPSITMYVLVFLTGVGVAHS
ncbi:hypothetical protein HW555_005074 [Spodoptera exigua]|uniref:HAT C-terminal dimerisation domain-containing protein n=1 Tax=Spodoptera exigua TaxID=7107 RepID=A0A835GHQ1_SPOEX|nr:hypothetical protein HW555_005074 [Spodoptera exigua]